MNPSPETINIEFSRTLAHNNDVRVKSSKGDITICGDGVMQEMEAMLNVYYGELEADNYIFDPDTYFDNTYEDEWIVDELSVKMIKDIDRSDVVGPHLIKSSVLGMISQKELSGGVKTLILIDHDPDHIFNASACGDNCSKWLLEIGKHKDITVRLGYFMDFGNESIQVRIVNTDTIVTSSAELNRVVIENDLL